MSPTFVLPGLLWPISGAQELLGSTALPGLASLLLRAKLSHGPAQSLSDYLCRAFGAALPAPLAALRQAGEEVAQPSDGYWLCADPVNLRFNREHLLLSGAEQLSIEMDEAQAMVHSLNQTFADIGQFHTASPSRWYLKVSGAPQISFAALDDVIGRPIAHFPPEGPDAKLWNKTANELQVFCHNHAVNRSRETRGLPAINSLWLWGGGALEQAQLKAPAVSVAADHPVARGLARSAKCQLLAASQWRDADFCVIDSLQGPAVARDLSAWINALQALDAELFSPLAQKNQPVHIVAPGDAALLRIASHHRPAWHFWRKPASAASALCLQTPPHSR